MAKHRLSQESLDLFFGRKLSNTETEEMVIKDMK